MNGAFTAPWWTEWHQWLVFSGMLALGYAVALTTHAVFFRLVRRLAAAHPKYSMVTALYRPIQIIALMVVTLLLLPTAPLSGGARETLEHVLDLGLIGCAAWVVVVLIEEIQSLLAFRYRLDVLDNLVARRIQTRLQVFHHITVGAVVLVTLAVALMTFPNVRSLGASLLASAGLAGIIAGMAARPALSNLIAGLQIAFTEPIRLDDVVVVEGEWGRVEEIYATYVVVKIWDLRRLILPLSYFIEHPFQNWTRTSAEILTTVFLYVDYRVSLDVLRAELQRVLKSTPLWRGRVAVLQVTDAKEQTVQLRALMDASDSGRAWDLQCYVREKLILFLQGQHPESLPRQRLDVTAFPQPAETSMPFPVSH